MKTQKKAITCCLFMAVFILSFATNVTAQNANKYDPIKVEAGMRFIPTFAIFEMQTPEGENVRGQLVMGYGMGTFLNYNFTKHIGTQIEFNYSSVSRKYAQSDVSQTINLSYLEIPLMVSFNSDKTRLVNLNFVVGPQIGVNVGSNIYTKGSDALAYPLPVLKVRQGNVSLAYGFGADIGLNTKHTFRLGIGYRAVVGLINISNNKETLPPGSYYIMERTPLQTYSAYLGLSILL
jgi:hypothetical protein